MNDNELAKTFLIFHNWKFDVNIKDVGFHQCYVLGEDFSKEGSMVEFCEEFYGKSWLTFKEVTKSLGHIQKKR
ncbi:MAG: hypothetical protein Q7R52_02535 [archaeon]|nr:hypothetical protein [archaeon]